MMTRIRERDLIRPVLVLLSLARDGELTTTAIIEYLEASLCPQGEDKRILAKRYDTKFSQKVRNLKSHKTLVKAGLAVEIYRGFKITEAGRRWLRR